MNQNLGQFMARAPKRGSNVATGVNYGVASSSSSSDSKCNPATGIMRIRGPLKTIA